MVILAQVDVGQSLEEGLTTVLNFLPKVLAFILILVIGYIVAKALEKLLNGVLERVGFDRAVERGGVKQALARTQYDASDILAKLAFYAVMLFVLQLAFGVFGPNPISALLFGIIAFLPKIFVAIIIVVVAAAIAAAVRELIDVAIGGLSYGKILANAAAVVIIGIGVFAALNQVEIAPAIVNGLFYALLATVVGVVVVAVGGGGIQPMRQRWERALERVDDESSKMRQEISSTSREDIEQRARERAEQFDDSGRRQRQADSRSHTGAVHEPIEGVVIYDETHDEQSFASSDEFDETRQVSTDRYDDTMAMPADPYDDTTRIEDDSYGEPTQAPRPFESDALRRPRDSQDSDDGGGSFRQPPRR